MGVTGTNISANTFITAIAGNVLTLSVATGGTAGTAQVGLRAGDYGHE